MAITIRKGEEADLYTERLVSGEFAMTTDTKKLLIAFDSGDTKELATKEDFAEQIEEVEDIIEEGGAMVESFEQLAIVKCNVDDSQASSLTTYSSNKIEELIEEGGGGSGKGALELTQAEYNALTDDEKNNGTLYAIKDGTPAQYKADNVIYGNSTVKAALDSNAASIAALNNAAIKTIDYAFANVEFTGALKTLSITLPNDYHSVIGFLVFNCYPTTSWAFSVQMFSQNVSASAGQSQNISLTSSVNQKYATLNVRLIYK